jgi:hypothetical protein
MPELASHVSTLNIEVLAFAGCPNVEQARTNVRKALEAESASASVNQIEVDTPEMALSQHFLGSPTVRINGGDVEDGAETRQRYGLMCRTYKNGTAGAPCVEMIRDAIRRSARE